MQKINWNYPTTMWIGEDRIKDLNLACKVLKIKKPLLVTDDGLAKSKIIKDIFSDLQIKNVLIEIFSNVIGNPTGKNVIDGVDFFKKKDCDGVIAIGGGSALDVGKAIALIQYL